MAEVWAAWNESTRAEVALKVLARGGAEVERELAIEERFRNEARVTAGLSHRNIVRVFDLVEEADGTLALIMERLRGETLGAYVSRLGPRPSQDAVEIMIAILNALDHAHARGVVHRDVTPANIFLALDPDDHVTPKLVDFGIAKSTTTSHYASAPQVRTIAGLALGTPMYMAPERIRGGADEVDPRSDLFSAAVVLYETMTGIAPFGASSPAASLAAVLEQPVDPDPRIDPRLWLEIRRGMAKPLYERHNSARELAEALRAALGGAQESLQARVMREPPIAGDGDDPDDANIAGRSNRPTLQRERRFSSILWIAAVVVAATSGLVALLHARSAAERPAPALEAIQPPASAPTAPPALVPLSPADPVTPGEGTKPVREGAYSKPAPLKPPPRPKPIATTPGF
jgi:serine/threonine protein kinase